MYSTRFYCNSTPSVKEQKLSQKPIENLISKPNPWARSALSSALPSGMWPWWHTLHNAYVYKKRIVIEFIFFVWLFLPTICRCTCVGAFSVWRIKSPPHPGLLHSGQTVACDARGSEQWARKTGEQIVAATRISSVKSVITAVAAAQMEKCNQEYARSVYNTSC